jgi:hypothetical protein
MQCTYGKTAPKQIRKSLQNFVFLLVAIIAVCGLASAQHWTPAPTFPGSGAAQALLTPVGDVLVQEISGPSGAGTGNWYVLHPDPFGSYTTGTWSGPITTPSGYAPEFFGSAVLPDGRILIEGGEYNFGTLAETTMGSLFDPSSGTFSALVSPPSGWADIGDAPTVVLPNGNFMMGDCCSEKEAIFDAGSSTWTATGAGKADPNSEEGFTLLPNGKVLVVDTQNGSHAELYDYNTGEWTGAHDTLQPLTNRCVKGDVPEIGPAVLRPGGTVFATGASGYTGIYNVSKNKWSKGPIFPPNSAGLGQDGVVDGPASILPNGNVLVMASNINPCNIPPSDFYEFDGTNFLIAPSPPNAANDISYYGRMLVLPTGGHVLFTDNSTDVEIYVPLGSAKSSWAPTITSYPKSITQGGTYTLKGKQFNGLSQGAAYGDDAQSATNFPLVRLAIGGFTYYLPTSNFTMGVATGSAIVRTAFTLPFYVGKGTATLEVVANGIASNPVNITVK